MNIESRMKIVDQLYQQCMATANALRLLGYTEEAHELELWILETVAKEKAND